MINYRPLAYTAPNGTRLEFVYNGSISDETTHNLGEFSFASTDGKHYQDKTIATGVHSFVLKVKNEEDLRELRELLESKVAPDSPGILEHPDPTLGTFNVVVSKYSVNQNSLKGKGIITVNVDFFKTINDLLAGDADNAKSPASAENSLSTIKNLNDSQALDLTSAVQLDTGSGFASFVKTSIQMANLAKEKLSFIAQKVDEVNIAFTNTYADIVSGADQLARAPFTLAQKVQNLIQLPMLATESVKDRVAAYKDFVAESQLFGQPDQAEIDAGSPSGANVVAMRGVATFAAISSINYSMVSGQSVSIDKVKSGEQLPDSGFLSKDDIIEAIDTVLSTAKNTTDIFSLKAFQFGSDIFFTQYFDYSILEKELVSITIRNLNARIFSAITQKSITLERETSLVQLSAKLYKSVEVSAIEFLKDSNNLHGNNIYLIPQDTEIFYY